MKETIKSILKGMVIGVANIVPMSVAEPWRFLWVFTIN